VSPTTKLFIYKLPLLLAGVLYLGLATAAPTQDPGPLPHPPSPRTQAPPPPPPPPPATNQTYHSAPPPQSIHSPGDSPILNEPPKQPVDQIIKRFSERESEFKLERSNYTYTQTFSIQTIDDDDRPDGEYRMTSEIVFTPDGKRFERVTSAPQPTLQRIMLSEQDLEALAAASQQDHRRGRPRHGLIPGVQLLARGGAVDLHDPTLSRRAARSSRNPRSRARRYPSGREVDV